MRRPVFRLVLSTFLLFSCTDAETPTLQEGDDCSSSGGQQSGALGICAEGLSCVNNICASDNSTNNATNNSTAKSNDGELNQDETAIDCGGTMCDACADGMGCSIGTDCKSGLCLGDMCTPPTCGDGIVNNGETCDGDGGIGGSTPTCDIDCSAVECGDGLANAQAGETCDGDGLGTGGETADCNIDCGANSCGDGKLNITAGETCDDGNADNTDGCLDTCVIASCGDGFTQAGVEDCDDANAVDNDGCSNTCRLVVKTVFVTSQTSNGNFGGLAGADAFCQGLAEAAGLSGTYMAWLSDSTGSPSTRFTQSSPYMLTDGTPIANNWADLIDGTLQNPIGLTESGNAA